MDNPFDDTQREREDKVTRRVAGAGIAALLTLIGAAPVRTSPEPRPWLKHYNTEVPPQLGYPHVPIYSLLDTTGSSLAKQPNHTP